jgi:hypothetical protein
VPSRGAPEPRGVDGEGSAAAKEGILKWLDSVTQQKPAVQEVELRRVTKDTRELIRRTKSHRRDGGLLLDARDVRLLSRLSEEHGGDADRDERRRKEHGGLYGARPSSVTHR